MRSETLGCVVRRLRLVVAPTPPPASPDADLVRAFAVRRDPAAFEAIVRRHGPMVLGVCSRVLRDPADADDAFQATFLVLVRKARSLREPDRLAGWLHQVAQRTARKLRAVRLARARREGELFDVPVGEPVADFVWRELRPIFDQELGRLPDKLRLPVVLCFLEGHSKGEAARTLGWPEGTLAGRLQQAREKLRVRFAARGLTLSAGALAVALFEGVGSAAVSDRLIASTLQAAAIGPAGAAGAGVWALADGVTQAMFHTKAKAVAACVLAVGLVGTGTGVVLIPGSGPGEVVAGQTPNKPAPEAKEAKPYDFVEGRKQIDRAVEAAVIADLQRRNAGRRATVDAEKLRAALFDHLRSLRAEVERMRPLFAKGILPQAEWDRLQSEMRDTEEQFRKLPGEPAKDPERAILKAELEQLKERASWEERMVKKGFIAESQLKKTQIEIAKAEAALAKLDTPMAPDPRRAALEEIIKKAEEIVAQTAEGVKKGIVPHQELLTAQMKVLDYKLKLAELQDQRTADSKARDPRRMALEEIIKKVEEIVAQTTEGVRKGITPQQELLSVQMKVLDYKLRLAELNDRPATAPRTEPSGAGDDRRRSDLEIRKALVTQKETELRRAEALLKQNAISLEEIRRLKIDVARLRAEEATAAGDFPSAVGLYERVVAEWEATVAESKRLADRGTVARSELRLAEVALAEAKVDGLKAGVRRQLAEIVRIREKELAEAKILFDAKAIAAEDVRKAEHVLREAKLRLVDER